MAELKGSNTEKNLQAAFAGESQAFHKHSKNIHSTLVQLVKLA